MLDIEKKYGIKLSGIADEAGADIKSQIKAHKELGWDYIELRLFNGKNIASQISDEEFLHIKNLVEENNLKVSAFASKIGDWSRNIKDDFEIDKNDLITAAKRMNMVGAKYIRIMSWVGKDADEEYWHNEAVRRLRELSKIAEDYGIYLAHENCTGWGGLSASNMIKIKEEVASDNLVLLYDLGNVVCEGKEPKSYFDIMRNNFGYIHIKDAKLILGKETEEYSYCGEGDALIPEILKTVITEDNYKGFISIEPHVAAVVHVAGGHDVSEELKYESYVKYGRKLNKILNKL